jgi:N-carbamoylputrescine amidase
VACIFALKGAEVISYPSAIGSEPDWPDYSSAEAWDTILRAHGIANGVFVAAVNRVGVEDDMRFYGESFVSDPLGDFLSTAGSEEQTLLADVDSARNRDLRELLHFLRDWRIDTYGPLLHRVIGSS